MKVYVLVVESTFDLSYSYMSDDFFVYFSLEALFEELPEKVKQFPKRGSLEGREVVYCVSTLEDLKERVDSSDYDVAITRLYDKSGIGDESRFTVLTKEVIGE